MINHTQQTIMTRLLRWQVLPTTLWTEIMQLVS